MRLLAAIIVSAGTLSGVGADLARASTYAVRPGRFEANPRFHVTYEGHSTWHTDYHSTPPNPGYNPDTNDAHDSSSQHWSLSFRHPLGLTSSAADLSGAGGSTAATGHIWHRHIDGIYSFDNASTQCQVGASTAGRSSLVVQVRQSGQALELRALIPVSDVLNLLPQQCPGQGDSIDGLNDNYFMPGFSFAGGYGPERWFRSVQLSIPVAVLQRARRVTVHLRPARVAAPPKNCAVQHPSYEQCRTTGWWRGTLTLVRQA